MSQKRIHKTLEEVEAENGFAITPAGTGESAALREFEEEPFEEDYDDAEATAEFAEEEPEAAWEESQESFDDIASAAEELLTDETDGSGGDTSDVQAASVTSHDIVTARAPSLTLVAGTLLTLVGFTLSVLAMVAPGVGEAIVTNLTNCGLTPGLLTMTGLVTLTLVTVVRRHHVTLQSQLQLCLDDNVANAERLEYLVEAQRMNLSRRPASGEELEQVLLSLSRQDNKINNLTKALKMYGKPLVDVNRLATENGQKSKAIASQLTDLREGLDKLGDSAFDEKMMDPLAEMLDRKSRETMDEMMRAVELLSEQVASDVSKAVTDASNGDTVDTRPIVDAVRAELTDIRDSVSQIQLDTSRIVTTPAPTPSPAPTASKPAPTTTPTPTASKPASAPQSMGKPPEGPAQKISGEKKANSKAVLGAIAKLRKMR